MPPVVESLELQVVAALAEMDDAVFARQWESVTPEERKAMTLAALRLKQSLEDPTPGHLAMRLDPLTVQTPALTIIDRHLVDVRDAIATMYQRRAKFAELMRTGMDEDVAIERSAELVPARGVNRLIVSMPPQEGKSQRITRYGVLWLLKQFPMLRIGIVSYDGDKAGEFSQFIRGDIELFDGSLGNVDLGLRLVRDQRAKSRWSLTTGGSVYAIGIGGGLTGKPLDLLVIDDPVKDNKAAESLLQSQQGWEWWQTVARPRLAPWAPVIEVQTRWHELDLAGRMESKQREDEEGGVEHHDKWVVVNIPAQADHDPNEGEVDVLGREPGEFMASARGRTRAQWEATKSATESRFWFALFQGRPTPDVGDILLREWWRRYDVPLWTDMGDGTFRILGGYTVSLSCDFAFKDTKTSDFVVIQVWAKKGADSFLVYQVRARLSFVKTVDAVRRVATMFPQAHRKIIEAKANGDAVIDSLRHEISGIIPVSPDQSKEARARAVSPFVRAGNFFIPTSRVAMMHPSLAFTPDDFIVECTAFPNGTNDDQVDSFSQYAKVLYIEGGEAAILSPVGAGNRPRTRKEPVVKESPMAKRLARKS
jgi:predicted phage terminase large subunit-like protein